MKIFDSYPGGKGSDGVYQTLINLIPPHEVKICGFLGNCAIMRYIRPADLNIGVDIDETVISMWASKDNVIYPEPQSQSTLQPGKIKLYNSPFLEYWRNHGIRYNNKRTFLFLDPPYPMSVRKSQKDLYRFEMTDEDHEELLTTVIDADSIVMICTYDDDKNINRIYRSLLKHWTRINYNGKTRNGGVIEAVYINYDVPTELHDYSFIGKDCTERQRIKRKINRHVNRLIDLPPLERNAIVNQITSKFFRADK